MASRFFATDPKKGIAVLSDFYLIFTPAKLSNLLLASIYEKIYNAKFNNNFLGLMLKKATAQENERFLDALANDQRELMPAAVSLIVLILSNGIEKKCLMTMKTLKLRGYSNKLEGCCSLLAINLSNLNAGDVISQLRDGLKNQVLYEDESAVVFKQSNKLNVVSNLHRTILSSEKSIKDILKAHPELVVGLNDPGPITRQYMMDEGNYN